MWEGVLGAAEGISASGSARLVVGNLAPSEWVELVAGVSFRSSCPACGRKLRAQIYIAGTRI